MNIHTIVLLFIQWPKHVVVSIINRIKFTCFLTYPLPVPKSSRNAASSVLCFKITIQHLKLFSRHIPNCFMISQVLSSFLKSADCESVYQNEGISCTRCINLILSYYKLKFLWGSKSVSPYLCTFADPRQMEYV